MAASDMHYNNTEINEPGNTDSAQPAWGENGANIPAAPLPTSSEGTALNTGLSEHDVPDLPVPSSGEGESGDFNSNYPVAPLPESGENRAIDSGYSNGWLPGGSVITPWPTYPDQNSYYGQVRFLNASANTFPVTISVDNSAYAINSRFGTISNYDWITDGFHTITVRRSTGPRAILLQQTFPFSSGEKVTMILTDSSSGGLELVKISDTGCSNLPYNSGCFRFANMSYSGSVYDLLLYGGETVFRNVRFQQATPYKRAVAGTYQFYITNSNHFTMVRELPVIIIGAVSPGGIVREPLVSFETTIAAGHNYTAYAIGNTWSSNAFFRVMIVED